MTSWTHGRVEILTLSRAAGKSFDYIAQELGIGRKAVTDKWYRINNPVGKPSPWTPENVEIAKQKWLAGERAVDIGKALEVSDKAVHSKMKALGLAREPTRWSQELSDQIARLWCEGYSASMIAAQIGKTRSATMGRLHRMGCLRSKAGADSDRETKLRINRVKKSRSAPVIQIASSHKFLAVPFLDLKPSQCKFPMGDGPFLFCGQPAIEDDPYCPHCWRLTHQPRSTDHKRYYFREVA